MLFKRCIYRGWFKFFVLSSQNIVEKCSVMNKCGTEIFRRCAAPVVPAHNFARQAVICRMPRISGGNVGDAIVRIIRSVSAHAHDFRQQNIGLIDGPFRVIDE